MKYVKPELEVLELMSADVITASGNGGSTNGGLGGKENSGEYDGGVGFQHVL